MRALQLVYQVVFIWTYWWLLGAVDRLTHLHVFPPAWRSPVMPLVYSIMFSAFTATEWIPATKPIDDWLDWGIDMGRGKTTDDA